MILEDALEPNGQLAQCNNVTQATKSQSYLLGLSDGKQKCQVANGVQDGGSAPELKVGEEKAWQDTTDLASKEHMTVTCRVSSRGYSIGYPTCLSEVSMKSHTQPPRGAMQLQRGLIFGLQKQSNPPVCC